MFILDTNVVSGLMGDRQVEAVLTWLETCQSFDLFTTSITKAEILGGIAVLPEGQKRRALAGEAARMFESEFRGRVLPFNADCSAVYAELFAVRRRQGRPIGVLDLMIASIGYVNDATIVTRDTGGFEGWGLKLINPWQTS